VLAAKVGAAAVRKVKVRVLLRAAVGIFKALARWVRHIVKVGFVKSEGLVNGIPILAEEYDVRPLRHLQSFGEGGVQGDVERNREREAKTTALCVVIA